MVSMDLDVVSEQMYGVKAQTNTDRPLHYGTNNFRLNSHGLCSGTLTSKKDSPL